MDKNQATEQQFRRILWGYPDIVKKLFEVLGSALVEERRIIEEARDRRKERKAAEQQFTTNKAGNSNLAPGNEGLLVDNNVTVPPQPVPLEIHAVAQDRPDDHPPTLDECPRLTASSASTEALEPTSGIPIPKSSAEEVEASTSNEIEEVLSTSGANKEGLRIVYGKEGSGE